MGTQRSQAIKQIKEKIASGQRIQLLDIVRWMQSKDIETLGGIFVLLGQHQELLETMPPMDMLLNFYLNYFRRCIVENPTGDYDYADSRYTAAHSLVGWYRELRKDSSVPRDILVKVRNMIQEVYKGGDEGVRTCIVTGVLEHLFEDPEIESDFFEWKQDPLLKRACDEALEWAMWVRRSDPPST